MVSSKVGRDVLFEGILTVCVLLGAVLILICKTFELPEAHLLFCFGGQSFGLFCETQAQFCVSRYHKLFCDSRTLGGRHPSGRVCTAVGFQQPLPQPQPTPTPTHTHTHTDTHTHTHTHTHPPFTYFFIFLPTAA